MFQIRWKSHRYEVTPALYHVSLSVVVMCTEHSAIILYKAQIAELPNALHRNFTD